jgi:aryl-alcohol dehydrogenase-like predicted oxidoreductase
MTTKVNGMTQQTASAASAGTITIGGDLKVNRLGYGAMRVTGTGIWGSPPDREQAKAVLRRVAALGVNFIDTADSYGPNVSEELLGEALAPYAAGVVIATKAGLVRPGPGDWQPDGRPEHIREAIEGSLKRLKLDRIDLYQFHRVDPKVPFEESVGTFAELQREGKVRHVGLSNVSVDQLHAAQKIVPIVSVQNRYNFDDRSSEDVLTECERAGIAFLPWAPIGGISPLKNDQLQRVAAKHNATPLQIALAWLLKRSPVMLPIPGTGSLEHLEENIAAANITLGDDEFKLLGG